MSTIRWRSFCFVMLLSCTSLALADEEWEALTSEYNKAMESWKVEITKAQGDGEGESGMIMISDITSIPPHPSGKFQPRVRAYAEKRAGKADAVPALSWLVRENFAFPGMSSDDGSAEWALEQLAKDHATNPDVLSEMNMLPMVAMSVGQESLVSFLETVASKNPNRKNQGRAQLGIAEVLFEDSPIMMMGIRRKPDRSAQKERAEKILRSLASEFAGTEIAEEAEELLFAIEHLQVGMTAPEAAGDNVDGKTLNLSGFRGKVVVMAFWATWCAPCMQMLPHERELADMYKDKPFTILGINVDEERSTLRKAIKEHKISWPTIHDGMRKSGTIASKWRVNSFPTFVLIDHKGVIRQMGPMLVQMESMIDSLLVDALIDAQRHPKED